MKENLWLLISLIVLLAFTLSCTNSDTPSPNSSNDNKTILDNLLITSNDCTAPCWNNLVPEKSSETEFLNLINSANEQSFDDLWESHNDDALSSSYYRWRDQSTGLLGDAVFFDQTLAYLKFHPIEKRWEEFTLSDVINILGEPDEYTASVLNGGHGEIGMFLTLIFKDAGVSLTSFSWQYEAETTSFEPDCKITIGPDQWISDLQFGRPNKRDGKYAYEPVESWPGYGEIKLTQCVEQL